MNVAVALLAISQIVCAGALFYLYTQLEEIKKSKACRDKQPSAPGHPMPGQRR